MGIDQQTAYARSGARPRDQVCFWRERRYDDLECLKARFYRHSYAPHTHDTFAIGVILGGAEAFRYRGARHIAPAGSVVAVNPDELHDGEPVGDAYAYRMFYPSVAVVQEIADEQTGRAAGFPAFREAVVRDPELAAGFIHLHTLLEYGAPKLAVDEAFTTAMTAAVERHSYADPDGRRLGRESKAVGRARHLIDDLYMQDLTLSDLAAEAGFSRFHLLRAFRREIGITPHAYLTGRRVAAAKGLLAGGLPLSEIAVDCGFYDQSHFSRAFKGWVGLTPGQYRRGTRWPAA
ncbi:AraC family transcriptional regulator [Pelagibius litoralis]|uniref:AraC family transcriptional regulator n=1 Tax=Pelagibius litoralis TaxID=374515 RepID=A0A967EX78_9PROT|nr:AraC family transcriptional regulator [Pelagibius litoralis]NIA68135.1 AraC family transcriptional regulator [Pelagibius litoralis]